MHRDERRRARRHDAHGGPPEPQLVGHARGQGIGHVPCVDPVVLRVRRGRRRPDALDPVARGVAPGEHADRLRVGERVVPGALHGLPGALEEDPLLRVHEHGLLRAVAEERRVEAHDVLEQAGRRDELGRPDELRLHAELLQLLGRIEGDPLDSVLEHRPQRLDAARLREATGHSDDGDGVVGDRLPARGPRSRGRGAGSTRAETALPPAVAAGGPLLRCGREAADRRVLEQIHDGHVLAEPRPDRRRGPG